MLFFPLNIPLVYRYFPIVESVQAGVRTPQDTQADTQWCLQVVLGGYVEEKCPKKGGKMAKNGQNEQTSS